MPQILAVRLCFLSLFLSVCTFVSQAQQLTRFPGVTAVGSSATTLPVTITLQAGGTVNQVNVLTQGSEGLDFGDASDNCKSSSPYLAGQTCTVNVTFKPTAPGDRRGAVILLDGSRHTLATALLDASASGPIATFVPGRMTSIAGNSAFIFAGDGGAATKASLFLPFGVALDAAGDFYIADTYNNRIRKVNGKTGIISTVAGNGNVGSAGDGGSALNANLDNPSSVQLDSAGNLYIADTGNHLIRYVDVATGIISTIAGTRTGPGYSGDGGAATSAALNTPNSIAVDTNGTFYIADTGNNAIRFVDPSSGLIFTVAGTGTGGYTGDGGKAIAATLKRPWGVTLSTAGQIYIADQGNNAVRVVDASGYISTLAGNGTAAFAGDGGVASAARLDTPASIAIDAVGNVYIADSGNNRIRKINPTTHIITTIAGNSSSGNTGDNGPATAAALYGPYTIALDGSGSLFIADVFHNRIRKVLSNVGILAYPIMRVGSISATMNQTIENDGNSPVDLSSITAGTNAIVDATTTCSPSVPLATLAQCIVAANFAPTTIGNPVTGSILIDSNAANANNTLYVQGTVQSTNPSNVLLSSNPNPSITGNPVVFTIQVVSSGVLPTGSVTLLDGTDTIATAPLTNGLANITISNLAMGQHTLTATYAGDTNTSSGVSLPLLQIVENLPANSATTTSLASSANPVNAGVTLKLTATVTPVTAGGAALTGTVSFQEGSAVLGTADIVNNSASFSISNLSVGTHLLTAVYSGSTSYATSSSPVLTEVVVIAAPAVSVFSSANPSFLGQPVIFSVAVTGSSSTTPTGSVTLVDGSTNLGTSTLSAGGTVSFTIPSLTLGQHTITAKYSGDSLNGPGNSQPLTQTVSLEGSTTSLTGTATTISKGEEITLIANVYGSNGSVPTGTITFVSGSTQLGTATLNAAGVATLTLTPDQGSYSVVAQYPGDGLNLPSTSSPFAFTVGPTSQPFSFQVTPSSMSLSSGSHGSMQITLTTSSNFADTLSFGCAGLPTAATCTFSQDQIAVTGGTTKSLSVFLDTGNPLGAGPAASLRPPVSTRGTSVLASMLPVGALLALLLGRGRRRIRGIGLLLFAILLGTSAALSGCGSSYSVNPTPAGTYALQIVATGSTTGATYAVPVQLTVTK